ncbi:MAG TPA: hypothetical protein VEC16_04180, partial [Alphaproteobacteria bacterium]|nr:hypothetical protein [Alphaproteobacteria bacterium]
MAAKKQTKTDKEAEVQMTFSESSTAAKDSSSKKPANEKKVSSSDVKNSLVDLGKDIVKDIKKGENPKIELSVRGLSNVVYDQQSKTLGLGSKTAQRFFFNAAHSKKFLQTIEVASICKSLLDVQKHASLRDVFYMAKRTIPNTKINIVDEQKETDKVIEDLELITGFSRENLNVNANKMGSVAGKVVIE